MIDIDHFKHYNDTHGHPAGDLVLRRVAEVLKGNFRKTDIVTRYGGEEFAVIMPQTDKSQAIIAAQKVWRAILEYPFPRGDTQPLGRVTISTGLASFPSEAKDETELIAKADARLYMAKNEGRNRVIAHDVKVA
jgi:diguanylate cyclase (GGDEF)-like protein